MRMHLITAVIFALCCVGSVICEQDPEPQRPRVVTGRSRVATKYGIVAASQPLSARAGVQILERGGNAIDAAIAANAVEALVEPYYNGIGGDLFAIYYEAKTGKLYGVNAGGWAPTGLTPELLRSKGNTRMPSSGIYSRDRARRRQRVGDDARAIRQAADGGSARAGHLLRRRRVSCHRCDCESVERRDAQTADRPARGRSLPAGWAGAEFR
jgi:hypothetical protein